MTCGDDLNGSVTLRKGRAKPLQMHHPWVFADAVARTDGKPVSGDLITVHDHRGKFIAQGYYSSTSRIAVKLFSWRQGQRIDRAFWSRRIGRAVTMRSDFLGWGDPAGAVRLVNAEGDGTPGLIVDRYAGFLVVEFLTLGMAARRDMFVDILRELIETRGVFERSDPETSRHEGLSREPGVLWGETPPEFVEITEGGARFLVDLHGGQKTGFYLDQRDNRLRVAELAKGRRVLDAFCYTGAFALHAARAGAASVSAVDSSAVAVELARKSADLNGVDITFTRGNAFERLRMLALEGERFDLIVLDPPKLARGRAGVPKALRAYKDADLSALKLLSPGGVLVTCCCSGVVSEADFLRALGDAAVDAGRNVTIIERRRASRDHPFTPACLETDYLQCLIARTTDLD